MQTDWMALTIAAATRAADESYPGPGMACIVVLEDKEIVRTRSSRSNDWHGLHAEHAALQELEAKGIDPADCVFYVNLEPCSERSLDGVPCADLLIAAGVRDVHVAIEDPYMRVRGEGVRKLKDAGVSVTIGEHAVGAYQANEAYFHRFCPNCGWVLKD